MRRVEGPDKVSGRARYSGDVRLAVQAVYTRSAGFTSSPDYWWGLINVTLIVPL